VLSLVLLELAFMTPPVLLLLLLVLVLVLLLKVQEVIHRARSHLRHSSPRQKLLQRSGRPERSKIKGRSESRGVTNQILVVHRSCWLCRLAEVLWTYRTYPPPGILALHRTTKPFLGFYFCLV
jgi:hypothetical protein